MKHRSRRNVEVTLNLFFVKNVAGCSSEDYDKEFYLWLFSLVLEYEDLYMENLPNAEYYERSYMHRDVVTHVAVTK